MKRIYFLMLVLAFLLPAGLVFAQSAENKDEKAPPKFDLDQYQFGLLSRGPKWTAEKSPEIQKIQDGHMANIQKMASLGKLIAAGPMMDDGSLGGIFIFKAASLEEAQSLAAEDPAIKAGRLELTLFNWMGPKGIGVKLNEEFRKDPNTKMTMGKHHLVLLKKGPKWSGAQTPENQKLQLAHMWFIKRMMDSGRMTAAGPLMSGGDLQGLFVFDTESAQEARTWAESDPKVKAGYLIVEIHPWYVAREVWPK